MALAISYNWLFLWDYTFYKWGFLSAYNWYNSGLNCGNITKIARLQLQSHLYHRVTANDGTRRHDLPSQVGGVVRAVPTEKVQSGAP